MDRFTVNTKDEPGALRSATPEDEGGPDSEILSWRTFIEADTPKAFCASWLALQCRMLKGVRCAMVLLGPEDKGPFTPIAVWPDAKTSVTHLTNAAERALKERRGLLIEPEGAGSPFHESCHLAYPIEVSGKLHGVVVLGVDRRGEEVQHLMRQLHWGAAWIEVMIRRAEALESAEVNERLQKALDLVASAVERERSHEAAMAFVTSLATSLGCDRVSLGFPSGKRTRVSILSHSAEFGKHTNLMRTIGAAMDEAIDQHQAIVYPPPPEEVPVITRAHEELDQLHGPEAICTVPLQLKDRRLGGLTLERSLDRPFDPDTIELCKAVAALVGPILDDKRAEERWLITKAVESFAKQLKKLLGPGHLVHKLAAVTTIMAIIFFSYFKVDYRVTAPTVIEGAIQRVIAAPFDGYIKEALARPGDVVKKGDVLCSLDDRRLILERLRWLTEKKQLARQHREAMAVHDRAESRILAAKIDQAAARISLLDEQLARCKVVAPFDGLVMSGDLSQSLGAPVERGQILFQVAPLRSYRVISEIDERDIGEIAVGQRSELVLPSMPGEVFPFVVEKITPVSTAREGRNFFRVEGRLKRTSERLRPGMKGIGKIAIDRRRLIWVWSHEALNWLRLQLWRWLP